ncbi:MAG: HRDC domain-containing protein, partial [Lactobacillales bacterium]|nr:HRDC domain-containing protein [Lactobacillales bacterium]
ARKKLSKKEAATLSEEAHTLYEKLKALRRSLADQENIPPYVIFSNQTLIEMANTRPKTMEAMAQINGVGAYKLKTYAPKFLEIVTADAT